MHDRGSEQTCAHPHLRTYERTRMSMREHARKRSHARKRERVHGRVPMRTSERAEAEQCWGETD